MMSYKWIGIAILAAAVAGAGLTLRQAAGQCGGCCQPAASARPAPKALAPGPAIAGRTGTTQPAASQPASAKPKFVNTRCPIMGGAIDPAKVPDSLTRTYKEQKVAFCCPMCLPTWDKLTPEEKDAKLKAAAGAKK